MISVTEARKILSESNERAKAKVVPLEESLDRCLSKDIFSPIDVPSFDNSAMDGYAMEFDGSTKEWRLGEVIQAGDTSVQKVETGTAARIFTGAKMPSGANTVIPQELIERDDTAGKIFCNHNKIEKGSNVRLKGSQCKEGELILTKGTMVTPGVIGLLASVGIAELEIYAPPTAGYIITGDELKEVGNDLQEGEIYDSNGPMLTALLEKAGIKEIKSYRASDNKEELQQIINEALENLDVVILSGGISVGDYDFVKECLENAGVRELFYKIKQRPGKPMFAGKKDGKFVFALPGNPASVLNCFNMYVKPCLRFLQGEENVWKPNAVLPLPVEQRKKPGLTFFLKARCEDGKLTILGGQQSFNLQAFSTANCLVELEEEKDVIKEGTLVNVYDL
jgi:molybdopterin molybdotransferase